MTHDEAKTLLTACRQEIDTVDRQILELLNARSRVVERIGVIKQEMDMPIYEPKREDEVYRNVLDNNTGPLPSESVKRIFERLIDEMRHLQKLRMQTHRTQEASRP